MTSNSEGSYKLGGALLVFLIAAGIYLIATGHVEQRG
jgi:hypothetical protein